MRPKNDHYEEIQQALRETLPAVETELQRDLWPAMLQRIQEQPAHSVPWYDWALAAAVLALAAFFPKVALLFAFHL